MTPVCSQSDRKLPGEWADHQRATCPECGRRVMIVAGRVRRHYQPSKVSQS